MRVGRLPFDVVLFSIVAFETREISRGSVATHLRYDGILSDSITLTNFLLIWQWNIVGKVKAYKNGVIFWGHRVHVDTIACDKQVRFKAQEYTRTSLL